MNTYRLSITACALILVAAWSPRAVAQSSFFDIELGYQTIDVNGNEDMYRTQIEEDDGFVLRNLTINFVDPSGDAGIADRLRIDAAGFGGSPAGRFRLDMGLGEIYRLHLFYQEINSFSALPAFANPLLEDGIVPGQHTWDRKRDLLDLRVEILPGRTITPIVGYRWNQYDGPGRTTYHVGGDEFQVDSNLEETESEFYVGLDFATGRIQGTFLQGWRDFEGTNRQTLAAGEGAGNNPGTILGQDVQLDAFNRSSRTTADTPVTTFHITGRVTDTSRFVASFVRADADGDTTMDESLNGSLVSFQLSRFFQGLDQSVESRTEHPFWRGGARFEWDINPTIGMQVGFEALDRQLEGRSLIASLFSDTLNFAGLDPRDLETLVEAETGYERKDNITNVRFDFRNLGPFSLWAEAAVNNQDLDVSEDVSQIVLPGGQEGAYTRRISTFDVGGVAAFGDFKVLLDVVGQNADDAIVRTDFNDRLRIRGRFDWSISHVFQVLLTAETISSDNDSSDIGYQADTDRYAVDFNVTPIDNFTLRLAYDSYSTDTEMPIRTPQDFEIVPSTYVEEGDLFDGGLTWKIWLLTIDAAYSTFENTGSFPFQMDRALARVAVDITESISAAAEYENWDYSEASFPIADYDADRWGLFLRWRR